MYYYKRLPLDKMSNCRDLGGYPTKYGKTTNFGVFVRSEAPVELTERDIEFLKDYKITKSLDFRGDADITLFPSSLRNIENIEYIHLPMFGRADAAGFEDNGDDPSKNFSGWGKSYVQWIEMYKGWIKDVIHELAETENACQFNCNAGKDRTGIISAFILSIAGVNLNDIAFDYCISRTMLKPRFPELTKQWGDYLKDKDGKLITNHPFLYTPKEAMEQLFKYIYIKYKNTENFLYSCNISEKDVFIIRNKMIG
ncbi:MAG: tyrosine-protein phosphatase [Ruminococcus sp.]|nr:tyrosine-protein phosphatase [Ruminococcus sp.]